MKTMRMWRALFAAGFLTACSQASDSTGPEDATATPQFSLATSGVEQVTMAGTALHLGKMSGGFVETTLGESSEVDPIVLVEGFPPQNPVPGTLVTFTGPQLFIGVLGTAAVGTYSVHKFGTHLKQRPEVYGVLTVRRADGGTRRYTLSDGTLTIQATRPLRGKFTFRSDTYTDWPASPTPGTTAPAQRGDLTISGSFSPPS